MLRRSKPANLLQNISAINGQRAKRRGRNHGLLAFSGRAPCTHVGSTVVEHAYVAADLWRGKLCVLQMRG
jgi:hypothetical protein